MPEAYPNKLEACQLLDDPQLATAMRKGTKVVHELAEKSVFTKRFLRGDINKSEYGQYIRSLYFVYKCMEGLLEKHQQHPAIEMIFFPDELNRVDALLEDLEFFYGAELLPRVTDPATMTPAVKQYVQSMEHAALVDPALLVSHSYARYLGDLSGGQILAKRLKKHILHLSKDDSSWDSQQGVAFYYFNNIGKLNEFKNLYREQLDQVPVTEALKTSIVDEAIWCFKLNIALFDEIQRLSESNALIDIDHQESTAPMADDMAKERDTGKLRATWPSLPSSWPNAAMALTSVALLSIGCSFYMRQKA
ncbi:heme oxygenase-domain-containing protein [Gongronella butleri]|nr:heme oxygenase-domain-containing protein [Gongronella butleri]